MGVLDDYVVDPDISLLDKTRIQAQVLVPVMRALRAEFGGYSDRGNKPNRAVKGSGSIARTALQQLEAAGLVQTVLAKGRIVTPQGRSRMDNAAHDVRAGVPTEHPARNQS